MCDVIGLLTDGPLPAVDASIDLTPLVAQCPRCRRYICTRHAEPVKVHLSEGGWLPRLLGLKTRCLCCPFDPGVALGMHDH